MVRAPIWVLIFSRAWTQQCFFPPVSDEEVSFLLYYHYFWKLNNVYIVGGKRITLPLQLTSALRETFISAQPDHDRWWREGNIMPAQMFFPFLSPFPNSGPTTTLRFIPLSPLFSMVIWVWIGKSDLSPAFCFNIPFIDTYFVSCTVADALRVILFFPHAV